MVTDRQVEVKANIVILILQNRTLKNDKQSTDFRDRYSDTELWVVKAAIRHGNPRAEVKVQCRRVDC
jgi:hypothetical protein